MSNIPYPRKNYGKKQQLPPFWYCSWGLAFFFWISELMSTSLSTCIRGLQRISLRKSKTAGWRQKNSRWISPKWPASNLRTWQRTSSAWISWEHYISRQATVSTENNTSALRIWNSLITWGITSFYIEQT